MSSIPRVVIVGGGFGGLYAALKLAHKPVEVTLIDRKNHHTFQPLLYQVATAGLSPAEIAPPIRAIFKQAKNIDVLLDEVTGFDLERRQVLLHGDRVAYDYLIVAGGATHAYYGHENWAPMAPGLKTVEDATEMRRRILLAFEIAERRERLEGKLTALNFVIVGGGPTGVELAGAVAEIAHRVVAGNFRSIDPSRARVILLEGGPRVLPAFAEDLSRSAERQLRGLRVEVMTNCMVTGVEPHRIHYDGGSVEAEVILWAAGVAASPLGKMLDAPVDRAGRVVVEADLTVQGHPEVFVVGDMASVKQADGKPVPGLAPAAMQMGKFAAETILDEVAGDERSKGSSAAVVGRSGGGAQATERTPAGGRRRGFHYFDKGMLATIGRNAGIGQIGKLHLSGLIAWLTWLLVHIYFLIGFRNRVQVIWGWAWAYFRYQKGARLITGNSDSITPGEAHDEVDVPQADAARPQSVPERKAS
jgi:NADH dehydrogenase